MALSLDRFYRIQNHEDGYHHYMEKVRQYRYELVDEVNKWGNPIYGLFRYDGAPHLRHQGFYHVKEADLTEVWWKVPSDAQRLEILARYPDVVF